MGNLDKNALLLLKFLKASFLVLLFISCTLMTSLMVLICNIAICADDTTLCSN